MKRYINNSLWRRTHLFFDDLAQYQAPLHAPLLPAEFFITMNNHYPLHQTATTRKGGLSAYYFI